MSTETPSTAQPPRLGLLLDGGGARAAYQVGLLRFLASEVPDLSVPILTGVSAGAINTAHLASRSGSFAESVEELSELWRRISVDQVFDVHSWQIVKTVLRWGLGLISGGRFSPSELRGLTDTAPLRRFLTDALELEDGKLVGIGRNIDRGVVDSVGITTTDYATVRATTWVQSHSPALWERPNRVAVECSLGLDHVLASVSLPLFFPATKIGEVWHGDGGIRLTAPFSPAVYLGAERVLAISTRFASEARDDTATLKIYPPPAYVAGVLLNAVFLDMLEYDARNLERINRLIEHVPVEERGGLRRVETLILRPSRDLGKLAAEHEPRLPGLFRFLTRGLGTRVTEGSDALSMLMFQHEFVDQLLALGEADARARGDEIIAFVNGE